MMCCHNFMTLLRHDKIIRSISLTDHARLYKLMCELRRVLSFLCFGCTMLSFNSINMNLETIMRFDPNSKMLTPHFRALSAECPRYAAGPCSRASALYGISASNPLHGICDYNIRYARTILMLLRS
jgi:hypothetical protein